MVYIIVHVYVQTHARPQPVENGHDRAEDKVTTPATPPPAPRPPPPAPKVRHIGQAQVEIAIGGIEVRVLNILYFRVSNMTCARFSMLKVE